MGGAGAAQVGRVRRSQRRRVFFSAVALCWEQPVSLHWWLSAFPRRRKTSESEIRNGELIKQIENKTEVPAEVEQEESSWGKDAQPHVSHLHPWFTLHLPWRSWGRWF